MKLLFIGIVGTSVYTPKALGIIRNLLDLGISALLGVVFCLFFRQTLLRNATIEFLYDGTKQGSPLNFKRPIVRRVERRRKCP